jgi:serine-type D-Ala-D-Ala carboxypeptidase (penicillin-binding protein 5/6)
MRYLKFLSLLRRLLVFSIVLSLAWKFSSLTVVSSSPAVVRPTIPPPLPVPSPVPDHPLPAITAKNVFIIDRASQTVLFARNADMPVYPASTTKMMTAVVAYQRYPLSQTLVVTKTYPEGSNIHLQLGERVTVENLLYALLVQSANDAAEVLADNYCPSKVGLNCGKTAFVEAMNAKAENLHLTDTHFLNPTGLDEDGHYSSAADLARLADYLLGFPYLAKIVSTENAVIASADYSSYHSLTNVNSLLGKVSGVQGVKTGFTDKAGESLVTLVDRNGHEIIISLLGSSDRFTDTRNLIEWAYSAFTWPN